MADLSALEQQYGLPPGILSATMKVESGGNSRAVSDKGAQGGFQLMPATAKALGVDPFNPDHAAVGAAKLWRQNLDASGGDLDHAAMMYHGGPNTRIWGPKTHAYPGKILAALSGGQTQAPQSSDPIEAALTGTKPAAAPSTNDPIELALSGAHGGVDGADPTPARQAGHDAPAGPAVRDMAVVQGGQPTGPLQPQTGGMVEASFAPEMGQGAGPVGPGADANRANNGSSAKSFLQGVSDFGVGAASGVGNVIGTGAMGVGWGLDKLGVTTGATDKIDADNAAAEARLSSHMYNPDGYAAGGGRLVGNIAATLPLAELKLLQAAPEASGLVRGLAKYGNYGVQGAAAGTAVSGGHDVGTNAIVGGTLGPVGGAIGEHVLGPVVSKVKGLAAALRGTMPETVAEAGASSAFGRTQAEMQAQITSMIDNGSSASEIMSAVPDAAKFFKNPGAIKSWTDYRASGGKDAVHFADEVPATDTLDLAKGMKAAGARNGIEATTDLPLQVAEHAAALKANGVPDDHALNEASIRYVGGNPTVGAVTRERATMQAEKEGAKVASPEGAALASRAAENNAALHDTVQETVNGYGGVPAQGEASQAVAESLAKGSDAGRAQTKAAYDTARASDGDQRVSIDGLRELLARPDYRAPTTAEGKQLVSGLKGQIAAMAKENGGRFSPEEIDTLTKQANAAFNPLGGGANHMIGEVKAQLGESLDQFDNASPAFKAARALHRQWAEQYSDPAGVARLIQRDAKGNFLNEDNWRRADNGLIGTTSDKAFAQVTRQLKANGDTQPIDRLKAEIVQRAYQRATNTAADESGNPVFSAKQWHTELNKIGMPKLKAVFSQDEIAHLATVGRAARALHESVPGTVNGSGTSAALINALSGVKNGKELGHVATALGKALKVGGHVASSTIPMGHVAVEGIAHVAGKVSGARSTAAANKSLAKAIRETLDPAAARTAANENATAAVAKGQRKDLARGLARHTAPAAAASQRNR